MSPYAFVKDIILKYREDHTWSQTVTSAGTARNTLVDIIEGKETGYHDKLILIVHGLSGLQSRNEFVLKFRDYSPIFQNMASFIDHFDVKSGVVYPSKDDLLKPKTLEILMYTGSDHGISIQKLHSLLPHRINLIKMMEDREIIHIKDGRYFSHFDNSDPSMILDIIRVKLGVKIDTSLDEDTLTTAFGGDDSFSVEGVREFLELGSFIRKRFYEIKEKHSRADGITISCNAFITTLGLDKNTRKTILVSQEKSK